jgi:hypothetical protein
VRLTYAIGVANPALPMPLTFHNENYGTIFLSFDAVSVGTFFLFRFGACLLTLCLPSADKVPFVPTINIALAVHLFVMILFAMIALARLMKPMHSPEPTFMSHWVVRGLALIGASLSIYNAQISQHEHFADVHGALGLVLVLVTLLGPWLWHMLFSVHSSVPIVAVLVVMTQCVLGFIKMDSALLFAGVTIGLVVFLLLTEALFVNGFVAFASRKKTLHV